MTRRILLSALLAMLLLAGATTPAGGQAGTTVAAESVALSQSASCRYGDIEVIYRAQGAQRQAMTFTAAGGAVLDQFETDAFRADYSGLEYLLTEATTVPTTGTVVGVYAYVGTTPPDADTTAEFFVLYSCDERKTVDGGANQVLFTCVGPYGTCPQTADDALRSAGPVVTPAFTG